MVKYILIKYINTKKQTISQTPGMRRAPSLLSLLSDVSCRCNDCVYRISRYLGDPPSSGGSIPGVTPHMPS